MSKRNKWIIGIAGFIAAILIASFMTPNIGVVSERSVLVINHSKLVVLARMLSDYRDEFGVMPTTLDVVIPSNYTRVALCQRSFDDAGEPWIYHPEVVGGIILEAPFPINGVVQMIDSEFRVGEKK